MPIFVVEEKNNIESLLKKSSSFGMGGWWLGGTHMKPNTDFLREVEKQVPKDANVSRGLQSYALNMGRLVCVAAAQLLALGSAGQLV